MIGEAISHYRILSKLEAAGIGEVYLAEGTLHEQVIGVEILGISKRAPTLNTRELQFQTV